MKIQLIAAAAVATVALAGCATTSPGYGSGGYNNGYGNNGGYNNTNNRCADCGGMGQLVEKIQNDCKACHQDFR